MELKTTGDGSGTVVAVKLPEFDKGLVGVKLRFATKSAAEHELPFVTKSGHRNS